MTHLGMQLRKEGRRNEYERHKLQALNQRQKMVFFPGFFLHLYLLIYVFFIDKRIIQYVNQEDKLGQTQHVQL